MEIKALTVVTEQGASCYFASDDTAIIKAEYSICGDPYPCYHVIKNNALVAEIRCVKNILIDYKE